jgi:hypothetical protein
MGAGGSPASAGVGMSAVSSADQTNVQAGDNEILHLRRKRQSSTPSIMTMSGLPPEFSARRRKVSIVSQRRDR